MFVNNVERGELHSDYITKSVDLHMQRELAVFGVSAKGSIWTWYVDDDMPYHKALYGRTKDVRDRVQNGVCIGQLGRHSSIIGVETVASLRKVFDHEEQIKLNNVLRRLLNNNYALLTLW